MWWKRRRYLATYMKRIPSLIFTLLWAGIAIAQVALDDLFICERWFINAEASVLEYHGVDRAMAFKEAERIRTYALDEPYYWEKRVFLRLDPQENPALAMNVSTDSVLPFIDILNKAVSAGDVTLWKGLDYNGTDTVRAHEPIASAPIILKVDLHIDTVTLRAVPHIVGLSVERSDGRFAHFYYPELSWVLRKYKVETEKGTMSMDAYFRDFRFRASWLDCAQVPAEGACTPHQPSLEQQSELDALTELFFLERVLERERVIRSGKRDVNVDLHPYGPVRASVRFDEGGNLAEAELFKGEVRISTMRFARGEPSGPYRAYFPDGRLREEGRFAHGVREGPWAAWHPNGNIRSRRNYELGRLHGLQQVYCDNGQLWLEYGMERGEYEGAHKTWYPDGALKASGSMHQGIIRGEWDYHIRIRPALIAHLDQYNSTLHHLPDGAWKDGVISYHVTVRDTGERSPNGGLVWWAFRLEYSDVK